MDEPARDHFFIEPEPEPEPVAQLPTGCADNWRMTDFEHERLDVYRASVEFLLLADEIASTLPKGRAYLADQLRRSVGC